MIQKASIGVQTILTGKMNSVFRYCAESVFFGILVYALWPYYQYYIDPDAVSYLTLTKDYLDGHSYAAINAYWSPMGIWLTALWAKASGWHLFASAIFVNALGAWAALFTSQLLFDKFRKNILERCCFAFSMALFWCYVVYMQSFTDAWQVFFLLTGLLIVLKQDFEKNIFLWIFVGIIGALAYFSKAYSFYFFPAMVFAAVLIKMKKGKQIRWKRLITILLVSEITLLLCAFPWLWLIHQKYGIWTASTAGSLNMSWGLEGTYNLKKGISILLPPSNQYSLFYFEDPLMIQGHIAHFWDSPSMFAKMILRIGYNVLLWVESCNNLSAFYFIIWLFSIPALFLKRIFQISSTKFTILSAVFLIFPLPFYLLNFDEGRYLWFTVPLSAIIGLTLFDGLFFNKLPKWFLSLFVVLFFLSFAVHPVLVLKEHFKAGERQYQQAMSLKRLNIQGSFVSNLAYENGRSILPGLTWFSGNPWYCHALNQYSTQEILRDAKRYHVKYYFYFYEETGNDYQLKNRNSHAFPELTKGQIPGLKVFYLDY